MEKYRNKNGFIDISDLKKDARYYSFWFEYEGYKYYFKKRKNALDLYSELIAEELAKDFNIPSAHYDLAVYNEKTGVISKNVISDDDNYISMRKILINHYKDSCIVDTVNNLEHGKQY